MNQAADPQPVEDVQGDGRWRSQVRIYFEFKESFLLIGCVCCFVQSLFS